MPVPPPLLLITDRRSSVVPTEDAVAAALSSLPRGGATVLLREKDLPGRELLHLALRLRSITTERGCWLVISGRWDIAMASDANGVHLGGEAPPFAAVRAMLPASMAIGVSLHGSERAPSEATYALISPIYTTASKPEARPLGLDGLRVARSRNPAVLLFALGGLTDASHIAECLSAGADGVALRSAVLSASDPAARAHTLHEALREKLWK